MGKLSGGGNATLALLQKIENLENQLREQNEIKVVRADEFCDFVDDDTTFEYFAAYVRDGIINGYVIMDTKATTRQNICHVKPGYSPLINWVICDARSSVIPYSSVGTVWIPNDSKSAIQLFKNNNIVEKIYISFSYMIA